MSESKFEANWASHAESRNENLFILGIFHLWKDKLDELLSLFYQVLEGFNVASLLASWTTEVLEVQRVDIDWDALGQVHCEIARTVAMGVQAMETEENCLRFHGVLERVVMVLSAFELPFPMFWVLQPEDWVLTFFLGDSQHLLDPGWSLLYGDLLEYCFVLGVMQVIFRLHVWDIMTILIVICFYIWTNSIWAKLTKINSSAHSRSSKTKLTMLRLLS